jgi:hypothetical protein
VTIVLGRSQILVCNSRLVTEWMILFLQCRFEEVQLILRGNHWSIRVRVVQEKEDRKRKESEVTEGERTSREYSKTKRSDEGIPTARVSAPAHHKTREVGIWLQLH